jgi:hypothetical protein
MPRYYFNVRGHGTYDDHEGADFPDLKAACSAAIDTTHDFLAQRRKLAGGQRFEICDENGTILASVQIGEATVDAASAH